MPKLNLRISLPVIQVALQAILWFWGTHSAATVIVYESMAVPFAWPISLALNAPAALVTLCTYRLVTDSAYVDTTGFELLFLVCIAAFWFLFGNWLDGWSLGDWRLRPSLSVKLRGLRRFVSFACTFGMGVFFFFIAVRWNSYSLAEKIAKVLLFGWAVVLTVVSIAAAVRWFQIRHSMAAAPKARPI